MMDIFILPDVSTWQWLLIIICGILIGLSKTGITGTGLLVVPIFAGIFGGRPSAGIVLPMLIVADIFAVTYYNRHAEWKHIVRLLPWTMTGIGIGLFVGHFISDILFKHIIAIIVISGVAIVIWRDLRKNKDVPDIWWLAALLGLSGGFATMIGNAAGPIFSLYLISMRLPKNTFIGTRAWFFFIINLSKVPLHIYVWKTINFESLRFDMLIIPAILLGAFLGVRIVKIIPEKVYRIFIIVATIISAVVLLTG